MDQVRNKILIKFATGGQVDSPTIAGSLAGNDSKLRLGSDGNSPKRFMEATKSVSLGSDDGLEQHRIKNGGKKFK